MYKKIAKNEARLLQKEVRAYSSHAPPYRLAPTCLLPASTYRLPPPTCLPPASTYLPTACLLPAYGSARRRGTSAVAPGRDRTTTMTTTTTAAAAAAATARRRRRMRNAAGRSASKTRPTG